MDPDRTADRSGPIAGVDPRTIGEATGPLRAAQHRRAAAGGRRRGIDGLAMARPGVTLGDYVLLEKLGAGGMGVVFKARQKGLNRVVALKMIKAGVLADERHIRLFRSEAEAVAALDHPHIVPILDSGEHEGMLYYSMKLIDGQDLGQCLGRYRDDPAAIARLVARVAEAIAHAHQRGVLHRDLKPSNILVDERGEPHVIDFGLAKRLDAAAVETTTGNPVGTPGYMSPEQARGSRDGITTATDVYGLGTLLYALLTGRPPFSGSSAVEILRQVVDRRAAPPPRPESPGGPRPGDDLPEVPEQGAQGPIPFGPRAGRRPEPMARRPADPRPARLAGRARGQVGAAAQADRRALGRGGDRRDPRRRRPGLGMDGGRRGAGRGPGRRGHRPAPRLRGDAQPGRARLARRQCRAGRCATSMRRGRRGGSPTCAASSGTTSTASATRRSGCSPARPSLPSLAYSPDGRRLASASADHTVTLWDAATGRAIRKLAAGSPVKAVAFHPDGTTPGLRRRRFRGHPLGCGHRPADPHPPGAHPDRSGRWRTRPDGKVLASAGMDDRSSSGTPPPAALLRTIDDRSAADRLQRATARSSSRPAGAGRTIRAWDAATGALVRTIDRRRRHAGRSTAWRSRADGKVLASGSRDGTIHLRDAATGRLVATFRDHRNPVAITAWPSPPTARPSPPAACSTPR